MNTVCQMHEDDEYNLHYGFSAASQPKWRMYSNVGTVSILSNQSLQWIVSGAVLEKHKDDFIMNYNSLGKAARNKFYESGLKEKTYNCWKPFQN